MNNLIFVLVFGTGIASAIVGGVLFAFSGFVMKGLERISAASGMAAMQSINITVQNWLCSLLFFGTGLTSIILIVWSLMNGEQAGVGYVLTGGLLYVCGGLFVTAMFNVPWNNKLAKVEATSEAGHTLWKKFVPVWLLWNHVRTFACFAASSSFIIGLLQM